MGIIPGAVATASGVFYVFAVDIKRKKAYTLMLKK